jgi:hypothetical protein
VHPHHVRATSGARDLWQTYSYWRYTILFAALLLTLAAGAVPSTLAFQVPLLELCLAITLLVAVLPLEDRRTRHIFLAVLVVVVAVWGGTAWGDQTPLAPLTRVLWPVVALLAAARTLRFALGARRVDREHLCAWFSAYLLAGMFFGVCYWGVEQTWAGALVIPRESLHLPVSLATAIYYSFVTLTWLGYGDLVPGNEVVRSLAMLEAVAGRLSLAVMIVQLVRLSVAGAGRGTPRET